MSVLLYHRPLTDGNWLSRPLFWPFSSLSESPAAGAAQLCKLIQAEGPNLEASEIFRRQISGEPVLQTICLALEPPRAGPGWNRLLELHFDTLQWAHDPQRWLAWVPELQIEVYARSASKLQARLPGALKEALLRESQPMRLTSLLASQWAGAGQIERQSLHFEMPSPRHAAQKRNLTSQAEDRLVIQDCGRDLSQARFAPVYEMAADLKRLVGLLQGRQGRSVLLVGPSGLGKTALSYALVQQRQALKLPWQHIWETSGARLIAGSTGFGMWQERCQKLIRQARQKPTLVLLGNLYELTEVGKGSHSQLGIAGFLRPAIARGEILVLAECTPEQFTLLEAADPQLIAAFSRLDLSPDEAVRSKKILAGAARDLAHLHHVRLSEDALATVDRLHRRYGTYSVYPGRPLRFLRTLLADWPSGDGEQRPELDSQAVLTRFARETGLPGFLLDPAQHFDPEAARTWFATRVQGQPQAIAPLIDLLALLRTQLSQRHKPLASLLLIGPTGTGKTELAKTLAEFLFADRQRLLRLDMSEYGDSLAVERLIGGPGLSAEGLLTARVREQPFSVILLDEFEKAHPACFDLLLQVLGEGRLSDGRGRTADFSNSVIIMTSNLGAASFQQAAPGFVSSDSSHETAQSHFRKAVMAFLRPELFNRMDAIVPFLPLEPATLRALARREWQKALLRDGLQQRPIEYQIADEVFDYLANKGWDPRYGARPLKRALEREVLLPLAEALNRYPRRQPLQVQMTIAAGELNLQLRGQDLPAAGKSLSQGVVPVSELRRKLQQLRCQDVVRQLDNQLSRIHQLQRQMERHPKRSLMPEQMQELQQAGPLTSIFAGLDQLEADTRALELQGWQALFREQPENLDIRTLQAALAQLLLQMYRLQFAEPDRITLVLICTEPDWLAELSRTYGKLFALRKDRVQISVYQRGPDEVQGHWQLFTPEQQQHLLLGKIPVAVALAFELSGSGVAGYYHQEKGLHLRQYSQATVKSDEDYRQALITVPSGALKDYQLVPGGQLRQWMGQQELRRVWLERDRAIQDLVLDRSLTQVRDHPEISLQEALDERLEFAAQQLLQVDPR